MSPISSSMSWYHHGISASIDILGCELGSDGDFPDIGNFLWLKPSMTTSWRRLITEIRLFLSYLPIMHSVHVLFCCCWIRVNCTHIIQDYSTGTGIIVILWPLQCWSNDPDEYGSTHRISNAPIWNVLCNHTHIKKSTTTTNRFRPDKKWPPFFKHLKCIIWTKKNSDFDWCFTEISRHKNTIRLTKC